MNKAAPICLKVFLKFGLIAGCLRPAHFGLYRKQRQTSVLSDPVAIFNFNPVVGVGECHADNVAQKWRV
jgi:hypothetical protein